jgi:hypothetical protein
MYRQELGKTPEKIRKYRPQLPHYPKISLGFDREGIPALPP